jgi:hypothetical protein
MRGRRHEIASLDSVFYQQQFRKILRWLLVSTFFIFILIMALIYLVLFQPVQRFYANTTEGQILSMPGVVEQK